jgi:hypothetical protein
MTTTYNCTADPFVASVQPIYDPGRFPLNTANMIIMIIFTVICCTVFIFYARKYERLRVRSILCVLTSAAGVISIALNGPLGFTLGWLNYPCWLQLILNLICVPLLGAAFVLQLSLFLYLTMFQTVAKMQRNNLERFDVDVNPTLLESFVSAVKSLKWLFRDASTVKEGETLELLRAMRFLLSAKGLACLLVVLEIPVMIMIISLIFLRPAYINCTACQTSDEENILIIILAVGLIFLGTVLAFRTRKFTDRWELAREATIMCTWALLGFIGFLLQLLITQTSTWDYTVILNIGVCGILGTQTLYQVWKARQIHLKTLRRKDTQSMNENTKQSEHYLAVGNNNDSKDDSREVALLEGGGGSRQVAATSSTSASPHQQHQHQQQQQQQSLTTITSSMAIDVVPRSIAPHLYGILKNKVTTEEFAQFLATEFAIENLYVLESIAEWKRNYTSIDSKTRIVRAKKLYKAYIITDALYSVNISSSQYDAVQKVILLSDIPYEAFDPVATEIAILLERGAVHRYRAILLKQKRKENDGIVAPTV